ncbi:glycosyltransferase family 2 protein [Patescibacteria group bacterium]
MQATVIIPTYNRADILKECLEKLLKQDFVKNEFEIIVVDDGSTDNTKEVLEEFEKKSKVQFKALHQKNQGQGIARNYALRYAQGKIVILIGDDLMVLPDFVKQHVQYHRRFNKPNEAVLGFVSWDPRLEITPFMDWLTNGSSVMGKFGGHQFAFEKLEGKTKADYNFFYTINISLKTSVLKKYPFDSRFSSYGWEDIELGYRLTKKENLVLHYNPRAIGYHYHPMEEESLADRMRMIGKSAHLIHKKYPELNKVPSTWKKIAFALLSNPIPLFVFKKIRDISDGKYCTLYYYALSKKYFLKGLKEGA